MLRLSCDPHPRDKRACLPNISSPHSVKRTKSKNSISKNQWSGLILCFGPCTLVFNHCCRGRNRTSTRQLAIAQSSVVDPGRINIAINSALCCVYPVFPTPETRGHVCQNFITPQFVVQRTLTVQY
jgi:hypothetical protein